jgi:geranylgeranyl reductase family protein
MRSCDALIVGGGPAGSTCARALRLAGWNVVVLDRARFPRDKVCGGWVTPGVFRALDLEPLEYRATGLVLQEITGFRTGVIGQPAVETTYPRVVSYAIRRCEFDNFLLRRAQVCVRDNHPLTALRRERDRWIANDEIESPVVIGAGGHFCPVARQLQGDRDQRDPVIAKEAEFPVDREDSSVDQQMPELFFCRDLEGYAWCVRKRDYLNVGIGRRLHEGFADHLRDFAAFLNATGRVSRTSAIRWRGHAYHARGAGVRPLAADGVLIVGDAAGLAYPESGEGIRPAVESGLLAARTLIAAHGRLTRDALQPYEAAMHAAHRASAPTPQPLAPMVKALGRTLLRSRAFTRHVMLDRWFLRAVQ